MISYADNWRLWLNACKWAGRLRISAEPLTSEKVIMLQADKQAAAPRSDTPFDRLVGSEPDRNSLPVLPAGSWQIECWEGLQPVSFVGAMPMLISTITFGVGSIAGAGRAPMSNRRSLPRLVA